jgi:uncharacterized protein (TIGR00730 family)
MRLCVFCGSNPGRLPAYREAAASLGRSLAERGFGLVYGGASVGLMGVVADAALAAGADVIGVLPRALVAREIAHAGLTELRITESMHERKAMMAGLADGFVALPGGAGTLEEIFEVWTWAQLGEHAKPCGLLNVAGFYDRLLEFLDVARAEAFMRPEHRAMLLSEESPGALLAAFAAYRAPVVPKWIQPAEA